MMIGILIGIIIFLLAAVIFLSWYSVSALKKIQFMSQSIEDLDLGLQSFDQHLKYIYELEMYYGDETLEKLILHAKDVSETFTEFRKDYEIYNGEFNEEDFFEGENNETKNNPTETNKTGKNLLLERPWKCNSTICQYTRS